MFKIIKKGSNNFWHVFNNGAKNVAISDFEVVLDDVLNTFVIVLRNGANIPQIALSVLDIIVIDETASSIEETYLTASQLRARLVVLGYTAYLGAGNADAITGLISEGTNVTITGTGTLADPYVISSSGGSGTTPTLQEVTTAGNEVITTDGLNKVVFGVGSLEYYIRQTTGDAWGKVSEYTQAGLGMNIGDELGTGIKVEFNPFAGFRIYDGTNEIIITPTSATKNGVELATVNDIPTTPTLNEVTTAGNTTDKDLIVDDGTESTTIKKGNILFNTLLSIGDWLTTGLLFIQGNNGKAVLDTSYITTNNTYRFPNRSMTFAGTDETLAIDGSNANTDVDLGAFRIRASELVTQNSGSPTKSMALKGNNLTAEHVAEWQDMDYTGVADISQIPTALSELSEDTTHRLVTDTEKSTWNSKQNALSYTPFKFIQASQTAHTGTTAETILATATIPANSFSSNEILKALFGINKTGTGGAYTIRIRINTSNTLSGATTIATFTAGSGSAQLTVLSRNFTLLGGNLYGYPFATSQVNDVMNVAGTLGSTTYNTANTLYVFFTATLISSSDSLTPNLANLTN